MKNEKDAKKMAKKKGLTSEEIEAMKDRIEELNAGKAEGESIVLEKINKMPEPDRSMGKKLHAIIMKSAPSLTPRLWYGMPAYSKDDKVICFFQNAQKFKTRYATLGFSDKAHLDEGAIWPVTFAVMKLSATEEAKITALVKKAVN